MMKQLWRVSMVWAMAWGVGASAQPLTPTSYECNGDDHRVSYTTSSFTGAPTFSLTHDDKSYVRNGKDIVSVPSPLGRLVTVTTEMIADKETRSATLVLPTVHLQEAAEEVSFPTMLIKTTRRSSFAGPAGVLGVLHSSEYQEVKCKARWAAF